MQRFRRVTSRLLIAADRAPDVAWWVSHRHARRHTSTNLLLKTVFSGLTRCALLGEMSWRLMTATLNGVAKKRADEQSAEQHGLRDGHLVYAKGNEHERTRLVSGTDIRIHCHSLDLAAEPAELLSQVRGIGRELVKMSGAR